MKASSILVLGMAVLIGAPNASAQSFKEKLKNATEKVKQEVVKTVPGKKGADTKDGGKGIPKVNVAQPAAGLNVGNIGKAENKGTTNNLPATHTALFAPLGEPVDKAYGTKSVKPVKPPKDEEKQPDWMDARVLVYELDNESLVAEYLILDECLETGYFTIQSPAAFRHRAVQQEMVDRTDALNDMVELYYELKSEYYEDIDDTGFIDLDNKRFAGILARRPYQAVIRSSIVPFFTIEHRATWIEDESRRYFEEHGGYENAHKETWTVWQP